MEDPMPKTDTEHTPDQPTDEPEDSDLEPVVHDLRATVGILHHLIHSPSQVEKDEWGKVAEDLLALTERLDAVWIKAWKQHLAERRAHEAALAALEAEKAAPGSAEERERVEALWALLRSAVTVAAGQCHEAGFPLPGWRWEGEERP
jgi:hypothetical protein